MCKYKCAGQEGLVSYVFKTAHVLVIVAFCLDVSFKPL